jgi:hypothetical protein
MALTISLMLFSVILAAPLTEIGFSFSGEVREPFPKVIQVSPPERRTDSAGPRQDKTPRVVGRYPIVVGC